jgi:hypothetical protein
LGRHNQNISTFDQEFRSCLEGIEGSKNNSEIFEEEFLFQQGCLNK